MGLGKTKLDPDLYRDNFPRMSQTNHPAAIKNRSFIQFLIPWQFATSRRMFASILLGVSCLCPCRAVAWWNPIKTVAHTASSIGRVAVSVCDNAVTTVVAPVKTVAAVGRAAVSVGNATVTTVAAPVKTIMAVRSVMVGKKSFVRAASDAGKAFTGIPALVGQAVSKTTVAAQSVANLQSKQRVGLLLALMPNPAT